MTFRTREYVEESHHASMKVYEYLQYLNSHPVLYKAVIGVHESPHILTTEEARRGAKTLRINLRGAGNIFLLRSWRMQNNLNLENHQTEQRECAETKMLADFHKQMNTSRSCSSINSWDESILG